MLPQRVAALTCWRLYLPLKKSSTRCTVDAYKCRTYQTKTSKEPFLNGSSSIYVEEMYKAWLKNPESVHKSWDAFFRSTAEGAEPGVAYQSPPLTPQYVHVPVGSLQGTSALAPTSLAPQYVEPRGIEDHLSVQAIIRSYQVNMPADSFESPLTLAACGGHVELAMLLLDRGANIEEVNDEGYTPLMEAAREGHEGMVALLLSQGADINAQTEETQETALTLACCGGFLEVADFLIKAGADIELGASTPLMEAAQEGHLELVRYLIAAGANVNATTATGDTALTYACENGHTDVADLLLQAFAKLEHESEGGRTLLMKAARAGHLCTVQFLISKGANVNKQTTNNDHNPLSLAGGHLPIVELLLAHGADPTHKLKDNSTMLIEAAKGGQTAVVQLLLDYPNSLLSSPPPPPDMAQMANSSVETIEAPRVPLFIPQDSDAQNPVSGSSYLGNVQTVPRIQDILRETMPSSAPQAVPKQKTTQRKSGLVKNNEAPSSSFCDSAQRYYRSKTNAAVSMTLQTETGTMPNEHLPAFVGGGGGNIIETDDKSLKPSERLEACINSMMKKAEMLQSRRADSSETADSGRTAAR